MFWNGFKLQNTNGVEVSVPVGNLDHTLHVVALTTLVVSGGTIYLIVSLFRRSERIQKKEWWVKMLVSSSLTCSSSIIHEDPDTTWHSSNRCISSQICNKYWIKYDVKCSPQTEDRHMIILYRSTSTYFLREILLCNGKSHHPMKFSLWMQPLPLLCTSLKLGASST